MALEILFSNSAVAAAIRAGKVESIDNVILTSRSEGMLTLDESIDRLLKEERIGGETAKRFLSHPGRS